MRAILAVFVLCAGCGAEDAFFTLRVIGSDGSGARGEVSFDAVDAIRIVIDPMENVRFAPAPLEEFEGGNVRTIVSSAGEFVIALERPYLESILLREGGGFELDVPLTSGGAGEAPDPIVSVELLQRLTSGEQVIGTFRRALPWPLTTGEVETFTIGCTAGLEERCLSAERP